MVVVYPILQITGMIDMLPSFQDIPKVKGWSFLNIAGPAAFGMLLAVNVVNDNEKSEEVPPGCVAKLIGHSLWETLFRRLSVTLTAVVSFLRHSATSIVVERAQ